MRGRHECCTDVFGFLDDCGLGHDLLSILSVDVTGRATSLSIRRLRCPHLDPGNDRELLLHGDQVIMTIHSPHQHCCDNDRAHYRVA